MLNAVYDVADTRPRSYATINETKKKKVVFGRVSPLVFFIIIRLSKKYRSKRVLSERGEVQVIVFDARTKISKWYFLTMMANVDGPTYHSPAGLIAQRLSGTEGSERVHALGSPSSKSSLRNHNLSSDEVKIMARLFI